MDLLASYKQNWKKHFRHLTPNNCHLVLAVSGGVDSVVLTDLVFKVGFDFTIAHCNFQLRGAASDNDEQFVKSLGEKYDKEVLVKHFDTQAYADNNKSSIQVAARELRYAWFEEIVNREQLVVSNQPTHHSPFTTHLLTAHHADDNIETVLMNIFRGTGISGLHGILPTQGKLIRSLLFANKASIIEYAQQHNLSWVEDASNATDKYSRNFFRHKIIPLVKEVYQNGEENLLANIERWKEVEQVYNQSIQLTKSKLVELKGNEVHIPVLKLQKQQPLNTITYEIVKEYGFTAAQVNDIIQLLKADNGKFVASATHRIIRNRNWIIIAPVASTVALNILIEEKDESIHFENGSIQVSVIEHSSSFLEDANLAQLDAAKVQFPLLLRKWKTGDYFYPLGMQKKKKISRFLIDKKLSTIQKEKIWVIESNQRIIWVVGQRIDNRFKIMPSTKQVLQLKLI
ncbi:MAG: tRNA lysidine(34) synthetase TilS [Chitinophagaceae bacterium]|nr:tRNA lysidine(34) synthetase TilS [Chitinophagaceae bacterium]